MLLSDFKTIPILRKLPCYCLLLLLTKMISFYFTYEIYFLFFYLYKAVSVLIFN